MKYDIVIFDFDGTLADTKDDVWGSIEYAAQSIGCRIPQEFQKNPQNLSLPIDMIFQSLIPKPDGLLKGLFECELTKHYRQLNSFPYSVLYPGIESLLRGLKSAGILCFIVSMKPMEALDKLIWSKGWNEYFNEWHSVESEEREYKSKHEILSMIQAGLKAKSYVYVGDSYTDIIAAKRAGMDSIGVLYGDGNSERVIRENPTYLVQSSFELSSILLEG